MKYLNFIILFIFVGFVLNTKDVILILLYSILTYANLEAIRIKKIFYLKKSSENNLN